MASRFATRDSSDVHFGRTRRAPPSASAGSSATTTTVMCGWSASRAAAVRAVSDTESLASTMTTSMRVRETASSTADGRRSISTSKPRRASKKPATRLKRPSRAATSTRSGLSERTFPVSTRGCSMAFAQDHESQSSRWHYRTGESVQVLRRVLAAPRRSGDFHESALDQAVLIRVASGLRPVREIQLAVDVRQVELHRLLGDPELLADRSVGKTLRDGLQGRELTLRQPGRLAQAPLVDLGESDCVEHRSLDRLPDCRRQIDRVDALDDVAARAVLEGRLDPLGITEDREHDHLDVRAVLLQLVQACEPVHLRHAHVEQDHVRAQPANERKHLATRARLAYDLDFLSTLKGPPDALDHQPMVVRNKNLHSRNSFSRSPGANLPNSHETVGSFTKSQYFSTPSIRRRSGPGLDLRRSSPGTF